MKTVKLAWNMLLADGAKSLLLVVQIALFIVLFNICTGTIFTANRLTEKVQNSRLKNAYYCNALHEESMPDGFPTYSPQYFTLEIGSYALCADVYSETYLKDSPVRLQYGAICYALQKNECLLSADVARLLGLRAGDTLYGKSDDREIQLKIKGVLSSDEQLLKFTVSGNALSLKMIYEKPVQTVILSDASSLDGVQLSPYLGCVVYKPDDITAAEMQQQLSPYADLTPFQSMLTEEQSENRSIVSLFASFAVVLFLVSMTGVFSNSFLSLQFHEKRFAVYFLCGMTKRRAAAVLALRNSLLALISCLFGTAVYLCIWQFSAVDEFAFLPGMLALSWLIVFLTVLISAVPIYVRAERLTPIRFFKEGIT